MERECPACRHFIYCEWPKIVYHKVSGADCEEFAPRDEKEDRTSDRT